MAIRYYLDLDCAPRRELGGGGLSELTKLREIVAAMVAEQPGKLSSETRIDLSIRDEDGNIGQREFTLAELREPIEPLSRLAVHCDQCPASLTTYPFDCHGSIFYPLSTRGEYWLLSQVAAEGTQARKVLEELLQSEGERYAQSMENWRKAGLFESQSPSKLPGEAMTISGDMIFGMLFSQEEILPEEALQLLFSFDALKGDQDERGDALTTVLQNFLEGAEGARAPQLDFALVGEASEDQTTEDLRRFLLTLFIGLSLQVPIIVEA